VPHTSSQWLYKTTDGGMTWTSVGGIATPTVTMSVTMSCSVFVDANDAKDVFAQLLLFPSGPGPGLGGEYSPVSETLWRSQDGGTTWSQLRMPQLFRGWAEITIVGTRIVALSAYSQQGTPECGVADVGGDDLYASDDGGQTWSTIGQELIRKGLSITARGTGGATLLDIGTTLVVQTFCVAQQGLNTQQTYWRSTDGGATWTALPLPAGVIEDMGFTPSPTGSFYGVAAVGTESSVGEQTASLLYSSDSGATWKALPPWTTVPGVQSSQFSALANIIALPDGSVLANILEGSSEPTAAYKIYVVDPQDATPTWQRYAPSSGEERWQIASTSSGMVMWGWEYGKGGSPQQAVYLSPVP
jgi:photosystem II stability/assembly factor-like uncharacterized protein